MKKFKVKCQTGGDLKPGTVFLPKNTFASGPVVMPLISPEDWAASAGGKAIIKQYEENGYKTKLENGQIVFTRGLGKKDSPYVGAFNALATGATGIANAVNNNKLRKTEQMQLMQSLEPDYYNNMEGQGLNNLPVYTQAGGQASDVSSVKAKKMLKDNSAQGHPLTLKQKKLFGWIAGGRKQAGGNTNLSVVDYLYAQGMDNDFGNRATMFKQIVGNEKYTGSAAQNIKLLNAVKQNKFPVKDWTGPTESAPSRVASIAVGNSAGSKRVTASAEVSGSIGNPVASNSKLQSGMVVDKRTGRGFVIQNGKVVSQYSVLTAKNVEGNRNNYPMSELESDPSKRATPVGNYYSQPNPDVYGLPGFAMNPIAAFGQSAPEASGVYQHRTYPPERAERNKLYNTSSPFASYGCVNMPDGTIKCLSKAFPKGDTTTVVDSKMPQGRKILSGYGIKQTGGMAETVGLPDDMADYGNVTAEAGEVFKQQDGNILKVKDSAPDHEEGGVDLAGVQRVLEDTSDKRKDKASKLLRMSPNEVDAIFGFKPKSSVSHAKAFELAKAYFDKERRKFDTGNKHINLKPEIDKYSANSFRLNNVNKDNVPKEDDVFNVLFEHQQHVKALHDIKDNGKMAKGGCDDCGHEAQAGADLGLYTGPKFPGNSANLYSPTGQTTEAKLTDKAIIDSYKKIGLDLSGYRGKQLQQAVYNYIIDKQPDVLRNILKTYGATNQAERLGLSKLKAFSDPANATPEDLKAALPGLLDAMPGARLPLPTVNEAQTQDPNFSPAADSNPDQPNVINPKFIKQPANKFYEPTHWYDVAPGAIALASSMTREPELYNPAEAHQLHYKLLDPTADLNANQSDFNAGLQSVEDMNMGSGMAAANVANLTAQKYKVNNQVLSNYENQNAGIKNNEITYNTQVRDKNSFLDADSRAKFYNNVLLGRDNQRLAKMKAIENLSRVAALKARQNTSGNLLLKLSPAFNQFGEYDGYQYSPTVNNEDMGVYPTAETKKTGKSKRTVTWKTGDGRTMKTEETN